MVIEGFPVSNTPKTKPVFETLEKMGVTKQRVLVGLNENNEILMKSLRNIPKLSMESIARFNPYILLANDRVVLLKQAFETLITSHGGQVKTLHRTDLYKKEDSIKQESK